MKIDPTSFLLFVLLWQAIFIVLDRAVVLLITFLKTFLVYLGKALKAESLVKFTNIIPDTLYNIRKAVGLQRDMFEKYGVCPECKTLYIFDECFCKKTNREVVSAKCSHVNFPRHPYQTHRRACVTVLSKTMR